MIEGARFAFEQFEIMKWFKGDAFLVPQAGVFGDSGVLAADVHAIHIALDDYRMMGIADGHGVVVAVKAHEGKLVRRCGRLFTRVEGTGRQGMERGAVLFEELSFRGAFTAEFTLKVFGAPLFEIGV